jgi:hypothetical protein
MTNLNGPGRVDFVSIAKRTMMILILITNDTRVEVEFSQLCKFESARGKSHQFSNLNRDLRKTSSERETKT